jgi:hypothetical protein
VVHIAKKPEAELITRASVSFLSALPFSGMAGQQPFFLPADGIEPEVIGTDIGIYVGSNARVQFDQVGSNGTSIDDG